MSGFAALHTKYETKKPSRPATIDPHVVTPEALEAPEALMGAAFRLIEY